MTTLPGDIVTELENSRGTPRHCSFLRPLSEMEVNVDAPREIEAELLRRANKCLELDPGHEPSSKTSKSFPITGCATL